VTVGYGGVSSDDEDGEGLDEAKWGFIPPEEMLPTDMAAPCVAHLLLHPPGSAGAASKAKEEKAK